MKLLDRFEEWTISLMLFAMTALAFMQVVRRYVFNTGFSWTLELTTVFFAVMIFVGISYGVRVGAHIGVDALVNLLSPSKRRAVGVLVIILCLIYVGFVLVGASTYVSKMMTIGVEMDDLPIERWKILAVMPFGFALVGFRCLQLMYNLLTGKADGLHLADEAADAMKLKAKEAQE